MELAQQCSQLIAPRFGLKCPELDALTGDASLAGGEVRKRRHTVTDVVVGFGQDCEIKVWTGFLRLLHKRHL